MSTAYDIQYHLAPFSGSIGTMVCDHCGEPILAKIKDFREAKKSCTLEGWRYVLHHRACLLNQTGFIKAEKDREDRFDHRSRLLNAAIAFRDEWGVDALDVLIYDLECRK